MDGIFDPQLATVKRFKTPAGKYAYAVLYDNEIVGQITRNSSGYGNPWRGFLYTEEERLYAGAGTEIKAVKSAVGRSLQENFARVIVRPVSQPQPEPENPPEPETEEKVTQNAEPSVAESKPARKTEPKTDKPAPEPTFCLCGCGGQTKPKSKFLQGHDAKAKGMLSRAKQSLSSDYEHKSDIPLPLPEILVNRAKADVDFSVAKITAKEILELAEAVGTR